MAASSSSHHRPSTATTAGRRTKRWGGTACARVALRALTLSCAAAALLVSASAPAAMADENDAATAVLRGSPLRGEAGRELQNRKRKNNRNRNGKKKRGPRQKNVCLEDFGKSSDPFRTCMTRTIACPDTNRDEYNAAAIEFTTKSPDPKSPLDPLYMPPPIMEGERMTSGEFHLSFFMDSEELTCDSEIKLEETVLKYLFDNIGSENTFVPLCVRLTSHEFADAITRGREKEVVVMAASMDIVYGTNMDFEDSIGGRKNNSRRKRKKNRNPNMRHLEGDREAKEEVGDGNISEDEFEAAHDNEGMYPSELEEQEWRHTARSLAERATDKYLAEKGLLLKHGLLGPAGKMELADAVESESNSELASLLRESAGAASDPTLDNGVSYHPDDGGELRLRVHDRSLSGEVFEALEDVRQGDRALQSSCKSIDHHNCCSQDSINGEKGMYCKDLGCSVRNCRQSHSVRKRRNPRHLHERGEGEVEYGKDAEEGDGGLSADAPHNRSLQSPNCPRGFRNNNFNAIMRRKAELSSVTNSNLVLGQSLTDTALVAECTLNKFVVDKGGVSIFTCDEYDEMGCGDVRDIKFKRFDELCLAPSAAPSGMGSMTPTSAMPTTTMMPTSILPTPTVG